MNPPLFNNITNQFVEFYIQHYICTYRRDIDIVYLKNTSRDFGLTTFRRIITNYKRPVDEVHQQCDFELTSFLDYSEALPENSQQIKCLHLER